MTFVTGTITSANPGPALYAALEATFLAEGYVLEDTVVIGARTHKVLKSPAAGNRIGKDFFLDVSFPTTGSAARLMIGPFEGFSASNDMATRGPYAGNDTAAPEQVNFSRFGDTAQALETNWNNSTASTGLGLALSTAAFTYWASITENRAIIFVSSDTTMLYSGLFIPTAAHEAHAGAALFPLIVCNLIANSAAVGSNTAASVRAAITRIPRWPGVSGSNHVDATYGWGAVVSVQNMLILSSGGAGRSAGYGTGEIAMADMIVLFGGSGANIYSGWVGTLDGVACGYVAGTAVRGDTVVVGADTWHMITPSANVGYFMQGV